MDAERNEALDFDIRPSDTLWTRSSIKVWWLIKFHGYRVITVRQVPRQAAFGRVKYSRRWLMSARKSQFSS